MYDELSKIQAALKWASESIQKAIAHAFLAASEAKEEKSPTGLEEKMRFEKTENFLKLQKACVEAAGDVQAILDNLHSDSPQNTAAAA